MRRVQRLFLYLAIVVLPVQDCILGRTALGFVGANLSSIPLAIHGVIEILIQCRRGRANISWHGVACCLYVLFISLFYILVWGPVSHEGSVIYKAFSGLIVLVLWTYTVFGINYNLSTGLRWSTYTAFLVMMLGVLVSDLSGMDQVSHSPIIHVTVDQGQGRWRGFSSEPSMFSATVVSLGVVSAYLSKRKTVKWLVLSLTILLLLLSQSKGALMVMSASGFVLLFLKRPGFFKLIALATVCSALTAIVGYWLFTQLSVLDLAQSTMTFATRISMAIWALVVIFHHPLGVGLGGFYQAITIYLPSVMDWLYRVSPVQMNFIEVQDYVNESMSSVALDTKCFLFEYVALFGIPFIVEYMFFTIKILRSLLRQKSELLLVGFIFLLIGMSTYVNGPALYTAFYLAGTAYWASQHMASSGTPTLVRPM
jgi:hypothetical protein